jgi:hypothetical protein
VPKGDLQDVTLTVLESDYAVAIKKCERCGEEAAFRRQCSKCGRWVCLDCFSMVRSAKHGVLVRCNGACLGEVVTDSEDVLVKGKLRRRKFTRTKQTNRQRVRRG